jgi:hypothetical protein
MFTEALDATWDSLPRHLSDREYLVWEVYFLIDLKIASMTRSRPRNSVIHNLLRIR